MERAPRQWVGVRNSRASNASLSLGRFPIWCAAAVLFLAGLLPGGWMPAASADGLTVVICTSAGAVEARLDLGTGQEPAHPADEAYKVCGFAAAAPVPPPGGPALPIPAALLPSAPTRGPPPAGPAAAPVRLPPSHAPPATV